ncbi:MAG: MFS transporter [Vicinamibacterales bacterium]
MSSSSALLRTNRNFRLLFFGQAVSQLGDWFNSVAVFALLLDLTGSATAVAWLMIVQFLPMAVIGPVAGVVVDRFDRRRLMIAADLVRGVLVLGLLLVHTRDDVWIAYAVMTLTVTASAFFEPARTATIPNVTSREELLSASALSSATWAAMLALGASIGGLVTAFAGREFAFVLNAASFFLSAVFISRTRINRAPRHAASAAGHVGVDAQASADGPPAASPRTRDWRGLVGLLDLSEGFGYVRRNSRVAALMCVKAGWGLAGGVLLLLSVFGHRVFPVAGSTAAGIGVLYGARGVGAGLAPLTLRFILGQSPAMMRRAIGPAYFIVGGFYVALAAAGSLPMAAACVLLAHFGGSMLWVFSTVLLQMEVPDAYRGRVFAAELALVTLTSSISSYVTGFALDVLGWSPRALSSVIGVGFAVPGVLWLIWNWRLPQVAELDATAPQQISRA